MATSLAAKYSTLSAGDCFKGPLRRPEESLLGSPYIDTNLGSNTFVLPPGKEVTIFICSSTINAHVYYFYAAC